VESDGFSDGGVQRVSVTVCATTVVSFEYGYVAAHEWLGHVSDSCVGWSDAPCLQVRRPFPWTNS
jgi:hypothetical protein